MLAPLRRRPWLSSIAYSICGAGLLFPGVASAHVKWFCAFDVAGQPRGLANVLCRDFELLVGLALVALLMGCVVEGTWVGAALQRALNRVTGWLATNAELLFRAICGFFFIALWSTGGILLTPELKTDWTAIPWLQLAIAAGMLWRSTLPLSALGIVLLFALALTRYGLFHLMDYPIFLGVAGYLALTGLNRTLFGLRPIDFVRWATAITLMWASIEKWAYPEWTFPLFVIHPGLTLGYDGEFYMRAAGVIEFTLSFALVWTPLVRRVAACMLIGMFLSAIPVFGKLDAIGHAPIIAVLMIIIAEPAAIAPAAHRMRALALAPACFAAALALFLALYYSLHALLFGTSIV
jgi:hypothetical protein